jgi:hypothetical protein
MDGLANRSMPCSNPIAVQQAQTPILEALTEPALETFGPRIRRNRAERFS